MVKLIAYQASEGVSIVIPTGEVPFEIVLKKDVPSGVNYKVITPDELPQDRHFRNAWILDDEVKIDLNKAKEIHKNSIRRVRRSLLESLDIQFQRALETGEDTSTIVAQKNALRDATNNPAIDSAASPEELKATWNEKLLGPSPYQ